jgi:hypothetical protein
MLTAKYGQKKQFHYRNPIIGYIDDRYGTKFISAVALGGAYCLENAESIERFILKQNPSNELTIVEWDLKSFRRILKSLTKIKSFEHDGMTIASGKFGKSTVSVVRASMQDYLLYCIEVRSRFHVIIADYYSTLNFKAERDLDVLLDNKLTHSKGSIFWTAADPRRACNTKACARIYKYDTGNGQKRYERGLKSYLKLKLRRSKIATKNVDLWSYKNSDISEHATTIHVTNIQLA